MNFLYCKRSEKRPIVLQCTEYVYSANRWVNRRNILLQGNTEEGIYSFLLVITFILMVGTCKELTQLFH